MVFDQQSDVFTMKDIQSSPLIVSLCWLRTLECQWRFFTRHKVLPCPRSSVSFTTSCH